MGAAVRNQASAFCRTNFGFFKNAKVHLPQDLLLAGRTNVEINIGIIFLFHSGADYTPKERGN